MQLSLPKLKRRSLTKLVVLVLLVALVCWGAIPGYLAGGKWRWASPPRIVVLKQLKQLKQDGLALTEWQTLDRQTPIIGDRQWVQQTIRANLSAEQRVDGSPTEATLFLFPQNGPMDQPAVEWTDLDGAQGWKTDSARTAEFVTSPLPALVSARFFRAWTEKQTYAVLQWYAWSGGGHAMPSHWFVVDRLAQWRDRRAAWVAVSVLLPIEPLGDIEKSWLKLESLAQTVQVNLMEGVLNDNAG
ncbi:cyanoexosortase B system-associated protein [Myxacorys almedinensis]|uniref:Cyanoexosortase B system-associated protein n=1 Tax=Myxacorys almedinensis A TaxID=2690445 RepID=A0A8J7Z130_9CYAN|nr:cyanoexosortase B system-associated protein [Myxacorys almedinensis]NDJ16193.1 cyanoexosortase B system-associated protein [Myxacorys almedinensis A]